MLRAFSTRDNENWEVLSLAPESLVEALGQGDLAPSKDGGWAYGMDTEDPDWMIYRV